ncbi:hypothetical protein BBJ28_00019403 [Nothophytophthora sp. Chile5]|nr:hypothetical protein BBJ28_00019403 [Nothophytophthora sp. Chile5]
MEQLVERYQDELADARGAAPCYRHRRMNAPDLYRVEEELFENQNLAPRGSTMRLQELVQSLSKDLYARSFDLSEPVAVPYAVLKSAELLKQTEDLLDDMLVEQGAARLDALAANSEVQRRRSEMVAECEKELKWTVDEFHDLAHTLERRQSPPP